MGGAAQKEKEASASFLKKRSKKLLFPTRDIATSWAQHPRWSCCRSDANTRKEQ
jgi:hypothetical protein